MPPTNPITKGTLDNEHGVKEVSIPANKAIRGANQGLLSIPVDSPSKNPLIMV